jgi:hypothetical protein
VSQPLLERAEGTRGAPAALGARRLDDRLFLICGLAWSAALIHVVAAIEHLDEYALYAVFFEVLASGQFLLGVALYRSPTRTLLITGAAGSLLVVALWIVSRTAGLPIGPVAWSPEPVGILDVLASADEAVLALLVLFQLRSAPTGALGRGAVYVVTATGVVVILLSSLALTLGGHAH